VADRDVRSFADDAGAASLIASGSAADVAAMMASLDALCWPPSPDDTRTMAQRKFDTLRDLVCGHRQPGDWQVQVLVALTTLQGRDELPAEIPGFGPIPASQAREIVAQGASLRRIVVDEHGQLVAVESRVHRPDLDVEDPWWTVEPVDDQPDPDAPAAADLVWHQAADWHQDAGLPDGATRCAEPTGGSEPELPVEAEPPLAAGPQTAQRRAAGGPQAWSAAGLLKALRWMSSEPWFGVDLSTDKYVVPRRLKRFLERRDKTCIYPGCPRPAAQCDKDHLLEWPRGRTSESNLASECDPHHHAKHEYFTVTRLPDGTFRWTAPNGRHYDRAPKPVLDSWSYRDLGRDTDDEPPDTEPPEPEPP
jgi:hypothetical protein